MPKIQDSLCFRLGLFGAQIESAYASGLQELGLRPKHVGLLATVEQGPAPSQQAVADRLGVAPSLVVALADDLVRLGALERIRDTVDRRRQVLQITPTGIELLEAASEVAERLDDTVAASLTGADRTRLKRLLDLLEITAG